MTNSTLEGRRQALLAGLALIPTGHALAHDGIPPKADLALKVHIVGRRRPGTTLAEHRHHIRRVHGEQVLRYVQQEPQNAPRRYVQNVVTDGCYRAGSPANDPLALNRDFVTQVWFPDFAALERSRQTEFYNAHLKGDEDSFVDQANVVFLPSHERQIVARRPVPAGAWKIFVLIQRAASASPAAFSSAWKEAAAQPTDAVLRHVQNDVLGRPGVTLPADGIDEFWLADEAAALAQLGTWRTRIEGALLRTGLMVDGSFAALIAREDVIHGGAL